MQYDKGEFDEAGRASSARSRSNRAATQSVIMLAETRNKQKRVADALPLYRKAIALEVAAGRKPDENWYKRAVAVAQGANSPLTPSWRATGSALTPRRPIGATRSPLCAKLGSRRR
jgi:hypothetical protein